MQKNRVIVLNLEGRHKYKNRYRNEFLTMINILEIVNYIKTKNRNEL